MSSATSTTRHVVGKIDPAQTAAAAAAATRFVLTDIPLLTTGNMVPGVTIRYPGPLTRLSPNGAGWWPSPDDTALERDPAFDSVIVIWQPTVTDQDTGESLWIGSAAGLTPGMGVNQMYTTLIIEAATLYGHLNVFKHEWGHSILAYFDAARTAPQPAVSNHAESTTYVNCLTGQYYNWIDETDANPIPNSIYNNASGFTHDYYSGTTALATNPTRCLGIPPITWATDGPVSKAIIDLTTLPITDVTPPATTAAVSPPTNTAGWNNSEVTVSLTSDDGEDGSGVKLITYSVAGAESIPATTVAGTRPPCSSRPKESAPLPFMPSTTPGTSRVGHELTVRIDRTAPALTASPDQVIQQTNGAGVVVTYPLRTFVETRQRTERSHLCARVRVDLCGRGDDRDLHRERPRGQRRLDAVQRHGNRRSSARPPDVRGRVDCQGEHAPSFFVSSLSARTSGQRAIRVLGRRPLKLLVATTILGHDNMPMAITTAMTGGIITICRTISRQRRSAALSFPTTRTSGRSADSRKW